MLLWTLLKKDLLRARRLPGNYIVMLMLPVALTAIMGFTFGAGDEESSVIPQIQVAMVDNDQDFLSGFIKISFQDDELKQLVKLHEVTREQGQQGLEDMDYSAMIIIPDGFTESYFARGSQTKQLTLIKNARERVLPSVIEDIFAVFSDGMSTLKLNAADQLTYLRDTIESEGGINEPTARIIADALGFQLSSEEPYFLPIIQTQYRKTQEDKKLDDAGRNATLFAHLFTGISAFFLLFLADTAAADIFAEARKNTLKRFRTLRFSLTVLMISKGISSVAIVFLSALILFGIGGLIFDVPLQNPIHMIVLCFAFSCFAAGLLTFLTNWTGNSDVSGTLNPIIIILIGFFGGGMIPVQNLPDAIRENISILMPNFWFYRNMVDLQLGRESDWLITSLMLMGTGLLLALVAALMLDRRLSKGVR